MTEDAEHNSLGSGVEASTKGTLTGRVAIESLDHTELNEDEADVGHVDVQASLLGVARRKGVMTRAHSIGVTDLSFAVVDHDFAASCVADDLPRAIDRVALNVVVGRGTVGTRGLNIPATIGIRDDVSIARLTRSILLRKWCNFRIRRAGSCRLAHQTLILGYPDFMPEEFETIERLESAGMLSLFGWAGASVFTRVGQDYDEAAGHGQQVVGMLSYTYLRDRLDRATSCGRFALPDDVARDMGIDMLRDGITLEDFEQMPRFESGVIVRRDLNGSPAWALGDCRWVLQSFEYGRVDHIYWPEKSETKDQVSRQPFEGLDTPLFEAEEFGLESVPVIAIDSFVGETFVLGHAFNRETGAYEVYFGRSRPQEHRSDPSWYWRRRVASGGPGTPWGIRRPDRPLLPGMPPTPLAPDLDVRLRGRTADGFAVGTGD